MWYDSSLRKQRSIAVAKGVQSAGEGAANVIPDRVVLSGTVRALTSETFQELHTRVEQVLVSLAGHPSSSIVCPLPVLTS